MEPNSGQSNPVQSTPSTSISTTASSSSPPPNQIQNTPPASNPPVKEGTSKKRTIFAIFLLIFFYLIGVIFVWFFTKWPKWAKTLVILPIFLAIIAILLSVVFIAIRPSGYVNKNSNIENTGSKNLINSGRTSLANDTKRLSAVTQLMNSVGAYTASNQGSLPSAILSLRPNTPTVISSTDTPGLCDDLVPEYIPALPVDPALNLPDIVESKCADYETGYTISIDQNDRITLSAPNSENDQEISITR